MPRKFLFCIIALLFVNTTAFADEFVMNNQANYDAYTYTNMVDCYSYHKSTGKNFAPNESHFGNTSAGVYIVYKNINFGNGGASHIKLNYSTYGNYDGILEFRKNSADGELLASYESQNNNFWYSPEKRTKQIINPMSAVGRFDLYVVIKNNTFGNLYGFEFVKQQSAYEPVDAYAALDRFCGIPEENIGENGILFNADNPLLLGDDSSRNVEYYVNFENKNAADIVIDAEVEIGGRMRIYNDCTSGELLFQTVIAAKDGKQTFKVGEKISELKNTQNLCIVFENSVRLTFKNFYFVSEGEIKTIDDTIFDVKNYDEINKAVDKENYIGSMDLAGAWVKWESVDFGTDVWPRKVSVRYGIGDGYSGSVMNIRIDSPDGEIIASVPFDYQEGINWGNPKTAETPMLKGITGIHDIYVTVDEGEYLTLWKAGNIFDIDFEPVNKKYFVSYNLSGYINDPQKILSVLTFLNDEDNPQGIVYVLAAYSKDGELIAYDFSNEKLSDGLNSFEKSLNYKTDGKEAYTVKAFVWDEKNTPLLKNNDVFYIE